MLPYEKIERTIIECKPSKPSAQGQIPAERTIAQRIEQGALLLDKPKGPTSHQVSEWVKNIVGAKKAGQAGTLDPAVTGLLPIGLGHATKVLGALLTSGKEYVCSMHIHSDMEEKTIHEVIKSFEGRIRQLPPIKSAIKRQWRFRTIYYIEVVEIQGREVLFKVGCQAGTYIRKLCSDIGEKLGCGAHMAQLIRTKSGGFNYEQMHTLQEITDAMHAHTQGDSKALDKILLPVEELVNHLPKVWVEDKCINGLCNGMKVQHNNVVKVHSDIQDSDLVAVMSLKNELFCLQLQQLFLKK